MTGISQLTRLALKHIDEVPQAERASILEAAVPHLPEEEAEMCSITARFIREAEAHQLQLFKHFSE